MKKTLSIVIQYQIYYYLFKPIIDFLLSDKYTIYIYCYHEVYKMVEKEYIEDQNIILIPLEIITNKSRYKLIKAFHRVLIIIFTPINFSKQYSNVYSDPKRQKSKIKKILYLIKKQTRFFDTANVNDRIHKLVSNLNITNPFKTDVVIVGSLNSTPELFCNSRVKTITVMESWDHPVKMPNGYKSAITFSWNDALSADWNAFQKDQLILNFFPLKLRFALNINKEYQTYSKITKKNKCVYAAASTKKFSFLKIVELEYRIIEEICKATLSAGWDLLIKPRPNGVIDEYIDFTCRYNHVSIGTYQESNDKIPANYFLSDEYNISRFNDIRDADIVINCFTTFGLDAAMAGYNVLQLDLSSNDEFKESNIYYDFHHIKKYLLGSEYVLIINNESSFKDQLYEKLNTNVLNYSNLYSNYLRTIFYPKNDLESQLQMFQNEIKKLY